MAEDHFQESAELHPDSDDSSSASRKPGVGKNRYWRRLLILEMLFIPLASQIGFLIGLYGGLVLSSSLDSSLPSLYAFLPFALAIIIALAVSLSAWSIWMVTIRGNARVVIPHSAFQRLIIPISFFLYYLLAWTIAQALGHYSYLSPAWGVFSGFGTPYPVIITCLLFFGPASEWFLVFQACELLLALLMIQRAARKQGVISSLRAGFGENDRGGFDRRLLVFALAIVLLAGIISVQLFARSQIYPRADLSAERVGAEVDLRFYRPFAPDSPLKKVSNPQLVIDDNYPVLDGATAAYPVYAGMAQSLYRGLDVNSVDSYVSCTTTPEAYQRLIAGEVDIFFGAQPSKGQRQLAEQQGVVLELTPIGHEAFVFMVNRDNPVSSLTLEQVQAIYQKRITNWAEVGGNNEPIIAYQRPADSGSQTIMLSMVMDGMPLPAAPREEYIGFMGGTVDAVAGYRNSTSAIGYSFRYYVTDMKQSSDVKLLAIDGIAPTAENIANGSYPFIIDFYAVTAGSTNPNTQRLIDWITSKQGQDFIEQCGYVRMKEQ